LHQQINQSAIPMLARSQEDLVFSSDFGDQIPDRLLWVTLLQQGVELDDPQRSLPTQTILWFCDSLWVLHEAAGPVPVLTELGFTLSDS